MVIAYQALKLDYPWPTRSRSRRSAQLDEFQAWLIDQRTAEDTGIVFTIFNWFRDASSTTSSPGSTSSPLADLGRDDGRRDAPRLAVRRPPRSRHRARRLRFVRPLRALGGEHGDAGADDRLGRPRAPHRCSDRDRRRPLEPLPTGVSPVLDAMQIVPAFAYLMPVVLLFSIGRAARSSRRSSTRSRRPCGSRRSGSAASPRTPSRRRPRWVRRRRQMLDEGAAPPSAADAAARRQPDDPLRALDGRHRGADRRRRSRCRRHQRPLHDPGLAILAGVAIVIMAMALDRSTEAIADRTDPPSAISTRPAEEAALAVPRRRRRDRRAVVVAKLFGARRLPGRCRGRGRTVDAPGCGSSVRSRACSTTSRTRRRSSSGSPSRPGTTSSRSSCCRSRISSSRRRGSRRSRD